MSALLILLYIALGVAWLFAWAEIFLRAGYNRWLCLVMIVPVVNLAVFLWFAFSRWPIYEFVVKDWQINRLKSQREKIVREIQSFGGTEELPELTNEAKKKKLAKIREQLERDVEKRKPQKEK